MASEGFYTAYFRCWQDRDVTFLENTTTGQTIEIPQTHETQVAEMLLRLCHARLYTQDAQVHSTLEPAAREDGE